MSNITYIIAAGIVACASIVYMCVAANKSYKRTLNNKLWVLGRKLGEEHAELYKQHGLGDEEVQREVDDIVADETLEVVFVEGFIEGFKSAYFGENL